MLPADRLEGAVALLRRWCAPGDEQAVSAYFERFVARSSSQLRFVADHPVETIRILRAVRALPLLHADLPSGVQADAIRGQLERTWLSLKVLGGASTVLTLPDDPADYTRGSSRSKYTLRKRSRTARERGIRVERIDDPARRQAIRLLADAYERVNPREAYRSAQPDNDDLLVAKHWFVAAVDDRPVMVAVLPAEGEWAAMRYFRVLEESEDATLARYLVMDELVRALAGEGVRHIVAGMGPHRLPNGMRQFQRMMGFRIRRLTVSAPRSSGAPLRVAAARPHAEGDGTTRAAPPAGLAL